MGIIKKTIIAPVVVSAFVFTTGFLGFSGVLKQTTNNNKYADWMTSLNDNLSLREVNMPGSHDAVALYSIANLAGQCQSLSLKNQLNLGSRFLDIRLKEEKGDLKAMHGFVDQRVTFKNISKTIETFLKNHPKEFIFFSIKNEASEEYNPNFEKALKKYLVGDSYYLNDTLPEKVGDVRGKAILLSRYAEPTMGINCFNGWKDSNSFVLPNDFYIQDTYKITSKEQKQEEIVKCFNETGHALKINFISAYRTDQFPPSYSISAAKDINPWINQEIEKYADRGIVLYDFISEENMDIFFNGLL